MSETVLIKLASTTSSCSVGVKPSKISASHKVIGLSLAGLDIGSIKTHHETSTELSRSSGVDAVTSRSIIPGRPYEGQSYRGGRETVEISAPHKGVRLHLARLDIGTLKAHHETSTELSAGSGADALASQSIKPGPQSVH